MTINKAGILSVLAIGLAAVVVTVQRQSEARLREQNAALQQQLSQAARLSADNQRLSNIVVQASSVQATVSTQLQELLNLRTEVNRLRQEKDDSNRVAQATSTDQTSELSAMRSELGALAEMIGDLRDDIQELYTVVEPPAAETRTAPTPSQPASSPNVPTETADAADRSLSIRMIETHAESFAEKLKRAAAAQDGETFQEVFGRYLQAQGVNTSLVAGLVFDERTGRVIVRASRPALDQIEQLTTALDRSE